MKGSWPVCGIAATGMCWGVGPGGGPGADPLWGGALGLFMGNLGLGLVLEAK